MKTNQIHSEIAGVIVAGCITYICTKTTVETRFGEATEDRAPPADGTVKIDLNTRRDQIDLLEEWDFVKVENGFVRTYLDQSELNVESRGKIVALSRSARKARSNEV